MIYPPGAIRTIEEMQAMIGKPVYMPLPGDVAHPAPRIGQYIIKFHPAGIVPRRPPNGTQRFFLRTEEAVDAAEMHAISVRDDWSTAWGADPVFFFSNFWFAHVYAQHATNLRV